MNSAREIRAVFALGGYMVGVQGDSALGDAVFQILVDFGLSPTVISAFDQFERSGKLPLTDEPMNMLPSVGDALPAQIIEAKYFHFQRPLVQAPVTSGRHQ
jgi:hypothetical protein